MHAPDETFHQPVRLGIMAALTARQPADEGHDFAHLKKLTNASDGNLGAHIDHLARAGYVEVSKAFVARRVRPPRRLSA